MTEEMQYIAITKDTGMPLAVEVAENKGGWIVFGNKPIVEHFTSQDLAGVTPNVLLMPIPDWILNECIFVWKTNEEISGLVIPEFDRLVSWTEIESYFFDPRNN